MPQHWTCFSDAVAAVHFLPLVLVLAAIQTSALFAPTKHVTKCGDEVYTWKSTSGHVTPLKHLHHIHKLDHVLILTLVRDGSSWGHGRTFTSYLSLLRSLDYPINKISLGLLVSDQITMLQIKQQITTHLSRKLYPQHPQPTFARVTLMRSVNDTGLPERAYHYGVVQRQQRRALAELRNRLLYTALRWEDAVLWLDADVEYIPPAALSAMVRSNKDIVAPWVVGKSGDTYDLSTHRRQNSRPGDEGIHLPGGLLIPHPHHVYRFMDAFQDAPGESVEVDSVGGAVLFVRGEVHRSGVAFPTTYIVGAGWEHEGYDGIETEGLCYLAKSLGYRCWGATKLKAVHS